MKKMLFTLVSMLTIAVSANAMSYEQARNEALFLTDKMAYELNLTDAQYEAAYEINLDYLMGVTSYNNVYGPYWERRNLDLSYILYQWQWDLYRAASYFYRPLYWDAGRWHFGIYIHYPRRDYFYFGRPHFYATYRGGHSWRHNGGRSWYEGRHHHYCPEVHRDHHVGMRNSWDRGDYRNNGGRSSTRITEGHGRNLDRNHHNEGNRSIEGNRNLGGHRNNGGSFDTNRNSGRGSFDTNRNSGRSSFDTNRSSGRSSFDTNRSNGRGSFDTNRNGGSGNHSFSGSRSSSSHSSSGNFSRGSSSHSSRGNASGSRSNSGGRR